MARFHGFVGVVSLRSEDDKAVALELSKRLGFLVAPFQLYPDDLGVVLIPYSRKRAWVIHFIIQTFSDRRKARREQGEDKIDPIRNLDYELEVVQSLARDYRPRKFGH